MIAEVFRRAEVRKVTDRRDLWLRRMYQRNLVWHHSIQINTAIYTVRIASSDTVDD